MKEFILLFHPLGSNETIQVSFRSKEPAVDFIELSKLEGYNMYQYILGDFTYNMPVEDLMKDEIRFTRILREQRSWWGLYKRKVTDILIEPRIGFYYPYEFGNYLYWFTKQEAVIESELLDWLNKQFPDRSTNIDDTFAGFNSHRLQMLHEDDYLIATDHDHQQQFGVAGRNEIINAILSRFKSSDLTEFEMETYVHNREPTHPS